MKQRSKYGMPPPDSRATFEHNVFLLVDELEQHAGDEAFLANRAWALGTHWSMHGIFPTEE